MNIAQKEARGNKVGDKAQHLAWLETERHAIELRLKSLMNDKDDLRRDKKELMRLIKQVAQEKEDHEQLKRDHYEKSQHFETDKVGFNRQREDFLKHRSDFVDVRDKLMRMQDVCYDHNEEWRRDQKRYIEKKKAWDSEEAKINHFSDRLKSMRNTMLGRRGEIYAQLNLQSQQIMRQLQELVPVGVQIRPPEERLHYRVSGAGLADANGVYLEIDEIGHELEMSAKMYSKKPPEDRHDLPTYFLMTQNMEPKKNDPPNAPVRSMWVIHQEAADDLVPEATHAVYQNEHGGVSIPMFDWRVSTEARENPDYRNFVEQYAPAPEVKAVHPKRDLRETLDLDTDSVISAPSGAPAYGADELMTRERRDLGRKEKALKGQLEKLVTRVQNVGDAYGRTHDSSQEFTNLLEDAVHEHFNELARVQTLRNTVRQLKTDLSLQKVMAKSFERTRLAHEAMESDASGSASGSEDENSDTFDADSDYDGDSGSGGSDRDEDDSSS